MQGYVFVPCTVCVGGGGSGCVENINRSVFNQILKDVIKLTKGGWRPSKQGVQDMAEMMGKVDLEGRVVILYGMDNATFYAEDEDGDRALPKPDKDKKYHVIGKVEVATAKQARGLIHNCEPILVRLKDNKMVLVTPGVRFFHEPCCVTV